MLQAGRQLYKIRTLSPVFYKIRTPSPVFLKDFPKINVISFAEIVFEKVNKLVLKLPE